MTNGKNSIGVEAASQVASDQADQNAECRDTNHIMTVNESESSDDASSVVLDERVQAQIGRQLSTFYRELVNQPIPQNFMDLLARLDRQEDGK